ncbi:MAG TPA: OmpA family protein [Candidatus Margulisiibacteriota bacterium]|nr:OmpA family protein [Candidatus Margulisiibacteriota bacterium]
MKRVWAVGIALMVGAWAHRAVAFPTETGETGLVTIPTTDVLPPWKPSVGILVDGAINPPQTTTGEIEVDHTHFTLGIGLLRNLEFTSEIPYVQFERNVPTDRHTDDIGGLRLGLKYRLLNEDNGAPLSAALLGAFVAGTGRDDFPAVLDRATVFGSREAYEVMAIVDKRLLKTPQGDATVTLNAGGLFFDKPSGFSVQNESLPFQRRFHGPNATFDVPFEFAAGLKLPLFMTSYAHGEFLNEFRGNTGIVDQVQGALPTRDFVGLRFANAYGFAVQGGADFGLSGYLDPYRFIASISYAMPAALPPRPLKLAHAPPPPPPPPVPTPVKKKIVLRGVHFDFDKATIRSDSVAILREAANTLKENSSVHVVVEGHTDSQGTEAYNQRLSLRRAEAVKEYLVKLGVAADRLTVRGKGESQPVASNDTEEGRAENRRVELLAEP